MSNHRYNLRNRKGVATNETATTTDESPSTTSKPPASPAPTTNGSQTTANITNGQQQQQQQRNDPDYESGTNWVHSGGIEANPYLFALLLLAPLLSLLLAHATSPAMADSALITHPLTRMIPHCVADPLGCLSSALSAAASVRPAYEGVRFVSMWTSAALLLERCLPGKIECGPETATGHVPEYVDNAVGHCVMYSMLFYLGSNIGLCGNSEERWFPRWSDELIETSGVCRYYAPYDFGIIYDTFPSSLAFLNLFGMVFCLFLTYKGLHYPSTRDSGSSGSYVKDYLWGTELYPRVCGLDLKRFVNCRFSMTFWQLAGLSYCYKSYILHGEVLDWGLFFAAISQYIYLVKFFVWEMGYMRSIDIIVDRAGYEIQWGCLVWVPAVYTLHSRFCVQHPSGLSFPMAFSLFLVSMLGVLLNYAADRERDVFRASRGKCLVWGSAPRYITAKYTVVDPSTGAETTKTSLLLASGFWGMARHFQYFFELTAAYSWCLLANPFKNGALVMFYAVFLNGLLVDRAKRDTEKCRLKYGKYYEEYCDLVPYKIVPGIF